MNVWFGLQNARDYGLMKEESRRRCVHFYACLCAFASDDSLSKEFSYYLNMEPGMMQFKESFLVLKFFSSAQQFL